MNNSNNNLASIFLACVLAGCHGSKGLQQDTAESQTVQATQSPYANPEAQLYADRLWLSYPKEQMDILSVHDTSECHAITAETASREGHAHGDCTVVNKDQDFKHDTLFRVHCYFREIVEGAKNVVCKFEDDDDKKTIIYNVRENGRLVLAPLI